MTYEKLIEEYKSLFDLTFPKPVNKRKSFLEIANVPHYETVISNFYSFYLDKNEEHKFGELFLKSLYDLIAEKTDKQIEFDDYSVYTEVSTKNGGRIDILIEEQDETKAIIIENKIYHTLNNDLIDYWKSVKATNNNKIGIVMTLEELETNNPNFINITHKQFIKKIKSNIGYYLNDCDDRHLLFIKDLFENILNLTSNKSDMSDTLKFYYENKDKIHELSEIKEEARFHFLNSIKETARILELEMENTKTKDYRCVIISKRPSLRYWLQLRQNSGVDFFTIYLDLYGKTKEKAGSLIDDKELIKQTNKKGITLEIYQETRDGISIASKSYSLTSDEFVDFGEFIADKIKTDWSDIVEIVKKKINNKV